MIVMEDDRKHKSVWQQSHWRCKLKAGNWLNPKNKPPKSQPVNEKDLPKFRDTFPNSLPVLADPTEFRSFRKKPSLRKQMPGRQNLTESYNSIDVIEKSTIIDMHNIRIFTGTWNVGGRSPQSGTDLEEMINSTQQADMYVLGFQEIVPLNAGNILSAEGNSHASKWLTFIHQTLNNSPFKDEAKHRKSISLNSNNPEDLSNSSWDYDFEKYNKKDSSFRKIKRKFSLSDNIILRRLTKKVDYSFSFRSLSSEEENIVSDDESLSPTAMSPISSPLSYSSDSGWVTFDCELKKETYSFIACKQMVGIFLCIWVRTDLKQNIRHLRASCVSRGIMGRLGNKGSISISMFLHQTSFCFVCTHLTSGQKEGDELRRNSDVLEILRKTRFRKDHKLTREKGPENILEHDRVIWLGDLNYRVAISYGVAKELVQTNNWGALLEKDQLYIQQREGRVFTGWNEGKINFAPTYKYCKNSDCYAIENLKSKKKHRVPAWCDRILWHGKGLKQILYFRGESTFSDHRPVYSVFEAQVEILNRYKLKNILKNSDPQLEVPQH